MEDQKTRKCEFKQITCLIIKMNILVTGGCGFIGSNFINYMLKTDVKIVNIDCLNYCANEKNVVSHSNYKFIKGNITSKDFVLHILNEYAIDAIIHFAAQSHVDNSFDNSLQYTTDNVYGTHVLLQASKEYGKLKKFLHFSTDEVYGEVDLDHTGCHEKSLLNPTNPYAATKAAAEFIVRSYYHSFKLPVIIIRCNNVYGPNQYPEKVIPKFIKQLTSDLKVTIQNGECKRAFLHVYDTAMAFIKILENGTIGEIYNIGCDEKMEYSILEVAELLIKKIKNSENYGEYIEYIEDRPFNDQRYYISNSKLKALGWEITIDFENGINDLIEKSKGSN